MTSTLEWPRRLAVVGTGLLGASVGLAARAAGVAEVVGADNDRRELRDALELEAITSRARSVEEAAEGATSSSPPPRSAPWPGCSPGPMPSTRTPSSPMSVARSFTF